MTPRNDDPFAPWNNPMNDSPFAPHNGMDADNPMKPWNNPLGKADDLNDNERRGYGLPPKKNYYDED